MPFRTLLTLASLMLPLTTAQAHEVWIEPLRWQIEAEEDLTAQLRNGEMFKGVNLSWNDRSTVLAERRQDGELTPVTGRLGDVPAFATAAPEEGLLTLIYQSGYSTITYREYEKFVSFVTEKGFPDVVEAHAARDLPQNPIKEAYVRFAKSLIAVGEGAGEDTPRGLELEVVALDNPYTHQGGDLRFQVLYRDVPLIENKVTVFARDAAGEVTAFDLETTAEGIVSFEPVPGTTYLVDTVVIREPARDLVLETQGSAWESLWASLTFQAPDGAQ